jgi:hypothetical protein
MYYRTKLNVMYKNEREGQTKEFWKQNTRLPTAAAGRFLNILTCFRNCYVVSLGMHTRCTADDDFLKSNSSYADYTHYGRMIPPIEMIPPGATVACMSLRAFSVS